MKYYFLLLLVALTACSNLSKKPEKKIEQQKLRTIERPKLLDSSVFGKPQPTIETRKIFELTEEQKSDFLLMFNHPDYQDIPPYKRVYEYLEERLSSFNYYSDTFIASESLSLNRGNCLSLAILTKALADIANVKVTHQLVETEPVYKKEKDIVLSSQHVRTVLYAEPTATFSLFTSRLTVDYFPTGRSRVLRNVDDDEFLTMYYKNIAAEKIIQDDNNAAFWHLKKSLSLKYDDPSGLNMMALLHERMDFPEYAAEIYRYGLQGENEKLELLNNYFSLLKRQGKIEESKVIEKQLEQYTDHNPFKWISVANTAYNATDYSKALYYYRKARDLAPYLHETFAGMARAQYKMGNIRAAEKSLSRAIEKVHKNSTREMYQAKYDMLSQLLGKSKPIIAANETE